MGGLVIWFGLVLVVVVAIFFGCGGRYVWLDDLVWWWLVVVGGDNYVVVICRDALVLAKVISFKGLTKTLQNLGEINVKVSTHVTDKQDGGGSVFRSEKVVCFVLDPPKEPKKKKAGHGAKVYSSAVNNIARDLCHFVVECCKTAL